MNTVYETHIMSNIQCRKINHIDRNNMQVAQSSQKKQVNEIQTLWCTPMQSPHSNHVLKNKPLHYYYYYYYYY